MSPTPETFPAWIAGLRKWHGWLQLSAERPYMHAEEEYNSYYGVAAVETREGEGFCNLLQAQQVDTTDSLSADPLAPPPQPSPHP